MKNISKTTKNQEKITKNRLKTGVKISNIESKNLVDSNPIYKRKVCTNCIFLKENVNKYLGSILGDLVCDNKESLIFNQSPKNINTFTCNKFEKL